MGEEKWEVGSSVLAQWFSKCGLRPEASVPWEVVRNSDSLTETY